jgi:hypothetical protein
VVNSLTKPDCPVLAVLISLQVLLNFGIAYSPLWATSRDFQLAPVSKYWKYWSHAGDMGLVSLVACSSTDVWLKHTAWMTMLGEKLRRVPQTAQPGWEVKSGALFLRSSESAQLCWVSVKGCHVQRPLAGSICVAYVDWRGKRTCRVDQVFLCRVYIDSNHRDSRIWVTACSWQSSRS